MRDGRGGPLAIRGHNWHSEFALVNGYSALITFGLGLITLPQITINEYGPILIRIKCVPSVRKVDMRLPGKGNSNAHSARPVYKNHLDDLVNLDQ